jgi:hypothetical protein
MCDFYLSAWANISEGCPIACTVEGSDVACLTLGEGHSSCEPTFDAASMRLLAQQAVGAIAEMDSRFEKERPGGARRSGHLQGIG